MAKTENVEKLVFSDDSKETFYLLDWHRKWMHNFNYILFLKMQMIFPELACCAMFWTGMKRLDAKLHVHGNYDAGQLFFHCKRSKDVERVLAEHAEAALVGLRKYWWLFLYFPACMSNISSRFVGSVRVKESPELRPVRDECTEFTKWILDIISSESFIVFEFYLWRPNNALSITIIIL